MARMVRVPLSWALPRHESARVQNHLAVVARPAPQSRCCPYERLDERIEVRFRAATPAL